MAIAHTYTPRGLVKIGLGSNEFNNPYRGPWNTSMDIIDAELHDDALYRTAVQGVNGVLVGNGLGGFSALSPEPIWNEPSFERGRQGGRYYPISVGSANSIINRQISNDEFVLYPIVWPANLDDFSSWWLGVGIVNTIYTGSIFFRICLYRSGANGYPTSRIGLSNIMDIGVFNGIKEISGWYQLDSGYLKPGALVWIGVQFGVFNDTVQFDCLPKESRWNYGGVDSDLNFGTGLLGTTWGATLEWRDDTPITELSPPVIYFRGV